jgi:hypothetical protein
MASDTFGGFCVLAIGICAAKPTTPHAMTKERNFIPKLLPEELWLGDDTFDSILRLDDVRSSSTLDTGTPTEFHPLTVCFREPKVNS